MWLFETHRGPCSPGCRWSAGGADAATTPWGPAHGVPRPSAPPVVPPVFRSPPAASWKPSRWLHHAFLAFLAGSVLQAPSHRPLKPAARGPLAPRLVSRAVLGPPCHRVPCLLPHPPLTPEHSSSPWELWWHPLTADGPTHGPTVPTPGQSQSSSGPLAPHETWRVRDGLCGYNSDILWGWEVLEPMLRVGLPTCLSFCKMGWETPPHPSLHSSQSWSHGQLSPGTWGP